jgi:hypothetical protein
MEIVDPVPNSKVLHVGQENAKDRWPIKGTHKVPHGPPQLEKEPSNFEVFNLKNFDI